MKEKERLKETESLEKINEMNDEMED